MTLNKQKGYNEKKGYSDTHTHILSAHIDVCCVVFRSYLIDDEVSAVLFLHDIELCKVWLFQLQTIPRKLRQHLPEHALGSWISGEGDAQYLQEPVQLGVLGGKRLCAA